MPEDFMEAEVDTSELDAMVKAGVRAVTRATELIADTLATEALPEEAPIGATGELSSPWETREEDPLTFVVFPSDEAFYAHMVARGTRDHGPSQARAMRVEDRWVAYVSGVPADPFDVRATERTEGRAQQLLEAALEEEGV